MWEIPALVQTCLPSRITVVTSGGDAPGMNAALRAVVRTACNRGIEVFGANRGYTGLVDDDLRSLGIPAVGNILHRGGTMLKSDRSSAFHEPGVRARVARQLRARDISGLVVIGGDGSLTGAHLLGGETGMPVVGLPGSIDNDIPGTDETIGFDTAVNTGLEAIDRIRDTAHSHERVFLVEVMGHSSGFIAAAVGLAGGAEIILLPDSRVDVETLANRLSVSKRRGKTSSLILVAEGSDVNFTQNLAQALSAHGHQSRACILGHLQRGGTPTGRDRLLASCLGASAVDHLCAGVHDVMLGVRDGRIQATALAEVISQRKPLTPGMLELARILSS